MAPGNTPGRKGRPVRYFAEGEGRRTGVTLKDTGQRDEYGLEPTDGIFSSPRQSTNKRPARKSTGTITSSEDMDVVISSAPDPTQVLTERRTARNATSVRKPPPVSRSPIKTSLGATPRRPPSMGPISSARRSITPTSARDPVNRRLDFTLSERPASAERSAMNKFGRSSTSAKKPRDIYDIGESPENIEDVQQQDELDEQLRGDEVLVNGTHGDSPLGGMDDSMQLLHENETALEQSNIQDTSTTASAKKRGRKPRQSIETHETSMFEAPIDEGGIDEPAVDFGEDVESANESVINEPEPEPPVTDKAAAKSSKKASKAKPVARKPVKPATQRPPRPPGPYIPRPLQRIRSQTPMEDDSASRTRSGRISYKPLEYWKGERAIYAPNSHLETIDEIIRVEDVTPIKRPQAQSKRQRKKRKLDIYEDGESEEEQPDEWERVEGVVRGLVRAWDPFMGVGVDEESLEQELALAASVIEARDAAEGNFQYAKTMTMPFFGSGIVELPPGGHKRSKNTRKMQMVFFVHYGKVTVEVAGTQFVITKGGVWQVPRGNFYSIQNDSEHDAKIFFAQGCEVVLEPVAQLTSPEKLHLNE